MQTTKTVRCPLCGQDADREGGWHWIYSKTDRMFCFFKAQWVYAPAA